MVLGWHNVEGTWCFPSAPGRGTRGLERQLRTLRRLVTVVPLAAALTDLAAGRPLPRRALAITFDDGYRDNLTLAGPMLRRLGLPATCFLVPELLSGRADPWWERLAWAFTAASAPGVEWAGQRLGLAGPTERRRAFRLVAQPLKEIDREQRTRAVDDLVARLAPPGRYDPSGQFLDWDGARALGEYMDLGSHSRYHAILSRETSDEQADDLLRARQELEDGLGREVRLLAYPNGTAADYDAATLAAARRAGYTHAITTRPGWTARDTPPLEVRRWVMNPERGLVDLGKLVRDLPLRVRG